MGRVRRPIHVLRTSACNLVHRPDCHSHSISTFCFGKKDGIPPKIRGSTDVVDPETVEAVGRVASPMSVRRERWRGVMDLDDEAASVRVREGAARDIVREECMYARLAKVGLDGKRRDQGTFRFWSIDTVGNFHVSNSCLLAIMSTFSSP